MSVIQIYIAVCDKCGCPDDMASDENEEVVRFIKMPEAGWIHTLDGDYCPDCQDNHDHHESSKP
jgi:hypothetical protein